MDVNKPCDCWYCRAERMKLRIAELKQRAKYWETEWRTAVEKFDNYMKVRGIPPRGDMNG